MKGVRRFSDITTSNLVHLRYDEEMNRDKKTQCDQSCYQPGLSDCVMWGSNWSYLSRSDTIRPTDCPNVPELEALLHLVSLWSSNQPHYKTEPHNLVLVVFDQQDQKCSSCGIGDDVADKLSFKTCWRNIRYFEMLYFLLIFSK